MSPFSQYLFNYLNSFKFMIDDNNPSFLKVKFLVVFHLWDYRVSHNIKIAFSIQLILSA